MAREFLNALAAGQQIGSNMEQQQRSRQLRNALAKGDMRSAVQADPGTAMAFQQEQRLGAQFQNQQQQQQQETQQAQKKQAALELLAIGRSVEAAKTDREKEMLIQHYQPQLEEKFGLQGEKLSPDEWVKEFNRFEPMLMASVYGDLPTDVQKEMFNVKEQGGTLVTLQPPGGGQTITRRRDSEEVDQLLQQGYTVAPSRQQVEQGEPGSFGPAGKTEVRQLRDKMAAAESFVNTAHDAINLLEENPDINTLTAGASSLVNDLQQEVKAFARNSGLEIEPSVLNENTYNDSFDRLGIDNRRMKSLITSLAFKAAAASGQTGRGVSDRDVRRFIEEVGATSSDPRAFAATLTDLAERTIRDVRINARTRGMDVEDMDFGLSSLPRLSGGDKQGGDADIVYELDENGNLVRTK